MNGIQEEAKSVSAQDAKAPFSIDLEEKEKMRKYKKEYRQKNKERIRAYRKKYDKEHKEEICLYQKKYREKHRAEMKKYGKNYWNKNKEKMSVINKLWAKNHLEKCNQYRRKRRAIRMGADGEKFSHLEIYERDGWICQICGKKVDKKLKYPNQLSASLDHIVPLSKGGSHSRSNVQLAHWICNVRIRTGGIKQLLIPLAKEEGNE